MLACVLQAAKTPSRNGGPFYGPNRGGPTFSNSRSKIKLRRNRVKNTTQGFTLLLLPIKRRVGVAEMVDVGVKNDLSVRAHVVALKDGSKMITKVWYCGSSLLYLRPSRLFSEGVA
jgi:hypothetical protein